VVDELTVEVTLERPFAPFLYLIAYDAAAVVPREEAERRGAEFASHPVGTGAFRLVSWRRDDQVVLEAFREHFRGAPYLDRIVFRIIPAEITRFNEYRTGNLDVADIPTGHCRAVQRDPGLTGEVAIWPILGTHAVRFNVERPPFTDKRIRLAVAHAIDPVPIVQGLLEGCVVAGKGILPPAMPGFNPGVARVAPDRERARRFLAEAGFPSGVDSALGRGFLSRRWGEGRADRGPRPIGGGKAALPFPRGRDGETCNVGCGRSPGFRIGLLAAAFPAPRRSWPLSPLSSPVTVAGPRRTCTGFPSFPQRKAPAPDLGKTLPHAVPPGNSGGFSCRAFPAFPKGSAPFQGGGR